MLTRRFYILFSLCIVMALSGAVYAPMLVLTKICLWVLGVATAIDALAAVVMSRYFVADRDVNQQLSLNQPGAVSVDLSLRLPRPWLNWLCITCMDIPPHSFRITGSTETHRTGRYTYHVTPTARGRYEFRLVRCFLSTRLPGLCVARRTLHVDSEVKVYPTYRNLDKLEIMARHDSNIGNKRLRKAGNNTDFDRIRAYVEGDDIRTINWAATARTNTLMVNTYTDERSKPIIPVVCAGPSMLIAHEGTTLLDSAVSAAVALAASATRHYDRAGLITVSHSGVETYLAPERTQSSVARILEKTYDFGLPPTPSESELIDDPDVLPEGVSPDVVARLRERVLSTEADADLEALTDFALARLSRRSLLVIFANFENITVARQTVPTLQRLSRRHTVVVVLFRNEGIEETARIGEPTSGKLSELRFRALCADYIEQQQILAADLRRMHINVVLTTPRNLTSAVLSTYIDLKNRNIV